jgi:hypothetical protein
MRGHCQHELSRAQIRTGRTVTPKGANIDAAAGRQQARVAPALAGIPSALLGLAARTP